MLTALTWCIFDLAASIIAVNSAFIEVDSLFVLLVLCKWHIIQKVTIQENSI